MNRWMQNFMKLQMRLQRIVLIKEKNQEERTMMTVHEMGDLLGIKKTDRYWLLHKGFFKQKLYWERLGLILPALKNGMPIRSNTKE